MAERNTLAVHIWDLYFYSFNVYTFLMLKID